MPEDFRTVTIPREDYEKLRDQSDFLNCLEAKGVKEWVGYAEAYELYRRVTNKWQRN